MDRETFFREAAAHIARLGGVPATGKVLTGTVLPVPRGVLYRWTRGAAGQKSACPPTYLRAAIIDILSATKEVRNG